MNRVTEVFLTIYSFFKYSLVPVYCSKDLPKEHDPAKKSVFCNKHRKVANKELRIISYNIMRDYNKKQIRVSLKKLMKKHNPDLVLIQEAPVRGKEAFWQDEMFANLNYFYAPLHQVKKQDKFYNFSHSGQLTLSRLGFTKKEIYQLPRVTGNFESYGHIIKRIALYTQVKNSEKKRIGVYNVHLENTCWQDSRRRQINYLLKIINQNNDDVAIIAGDFNTVLGRCEGGLRILEKNGFKRFLPRANFPKCLDQIYVRGALGKGARLKGKGSDHQPVGAKVYM